MLCVVCLALECNAQHTTLKDELFLPKHDSAAGQIVGGKLHLHLVAGQNADEVLAHLAGDVAEDFARGAALLQAELEHCVG